MSPQQIRDRVRRKLQSVGYGGWSENGKAIAKRSREKRIREIIQYLQLMSAEDVLTLNIIADELSRQ